MLDIGSVNDLGLGVREPQVQRGNDDLGQEEFLTLMLEQFRNQDPLSPAESGEFLGQLAQFGTVNGIQELQQSFESLSESLFSDQALQASNLVGRQVLVPSNFAALEAEQEITGGIELPVSSPGVNLQITDSSGRLVRQLSLGPNPQGIAPFAWDGLDDTGNPAPPGAYRIEAQAVQSGVSESVPVFINAEVQSVTFGGSTGGVVLNVAGVGELTLDQIKQIS